MIMTVANHIDVQKLSLSAQKALHQRVIEAYKKGIKRTQIAKTFGMSRQWVWKVLRAFEKYGEEAAIAGHSRGPKPETSDKMRRLSRQEEAKLMAWIIDSNIRTSVLHDWKGEAGYTYSFEGHSRSLSEDLGGTWYEYGLGANFNATKNLHLYADIEAADGGEVDTDYRVNLGARWSF